MAVAGLFVMLAALGGCAAPAPAPIAVETPVTGKPLDAIVGVYTEIPEGARSTEFLGTRRQGSGVLIDDHGLILTIGYLVMEADQAAVVGPSGDIIKASVVAYDPETGFGLLRAEGPVGAKPLRLGSSAGLAEGQRVLAVSFSGSRPVVVATVVSRRTFAGYWEYLLENAIFTVPVQSEFGGAALIDETGSLIGIGSLIVNDARQTEQPVFGNMFVPVDVLKPILEDMVASGRGRTPPAPWLGIYTEQAEGRVFITRIADGGPAQAAGLKPGDIIIGVDGHRVRDMTDFLRKVRLQGSAGANIPLDVLPTGAGSLDIARVVVTSGDRHDWLK